MDAVGARLLAIAGIFVIGAIGEMVFWRTNLPDEWVRPAPAPGASARTAGREESPRRRPRWS